jgi:endonuclease/exonuclease/phosphatase family metal-dependent hydrolase
MFLKKNYQILFIFLLLLISSCGDNTDEIVVVESELPAIAEFSVSTVEVVETEQLFTINIRFSKQTPMEGTIEFNINNITATYNEDYSLSNEPNGTSFNIDVPKDVASVSFDVLLIHDNDTDVEQVEFQMTSASGGVRLANRNLFLLVITEEVVVEEEENNKYANCLSALENNELNIVTWNIEFFPKKGITADLVADIVKNMDADVIAVQEINSISSFNAMADGLAGWESQVVNLSGSLDIGYLYKTSEVSVIDNVRAVATSVSPRPPVEITIRHNNGLEVTLLNIHLKCCGGSSNINRRAAASADMKDYIDQNLSDQNVIILGDFNDDINSDSPFINFINDSDNYQFADAAIAAGSQSNWSYPSWPSHIDHILITNELIDNLIEVKTLRMNDCLSNYDPDISDHRPIMATFR